MSKRLAGKRLFEAMGQSTKSRRIPWHIVRRGRVGVLPRWAVEALARGHLLQGPSTKP